MTDAEWRDFVVTGTWTSKLGSRARTGARTDLVWFVLVGGDVVLTTHVGGVRGRALRRDPNGPLLHG